MCVTCYVIWDYACVVCVWHVFDACVSHACVLSVCCDVCVVCVTCVFDVCCICVRVYDMRVTCVLNVCDLCIIRLIHV